MHRLIEHTANLIKELHTRVHEEFQKQPYGPGHRHVCEEFHANYDSLAFPGGYTAGLEKLRKGDLATIDTALVFLEVRPYFFRSQYMRTKLMRILKRLELDETQKNRFEKICSDPPKRPANTVKIEPYRKNSRP